MVSLVYPNVNKHIFPASRSPLANINTRPACESVHVEQPLRQERMSAPPPYSKEDPVLVQSNKKERPAKSQSKESKKDKKEPSLLLEVAVGYRLAKTLTEKRIQRREARLQRVHDAWMQLGVDTRSITSQGGQLPPHFWNPPNYGPEEMNARLAQLGL